MRQDMISRNDAVTYRCMQKLVTGSLAPVFTVRDYRRLQADFKVECGSAPMVQVQ